MNLDKSSWCGDIYTTLEKLRRDTKSQRNPEHLADLWLISRRARPLGSAASVPSRSVLTAKAASVISPPWLRRPEASITHRHHSVLLNKQMFDYFWPRCGSRWVWLPEPSRRFTWSAPGFRCVEIFGANVAHDKTRPSVFRLSCVHLTCSHFFFDCIVTWTL